MRNPFLSGIPAWLGACSLLLAWRADAAAPVPVEAYGRLPSIAQAALSPDGKVLAMVQSVDDSQIIVVVKISPQQLLRGLRLGNERVREIGWIDDAHLWITTAVNTVPIGVLSARSEWHMIQTYNVNSGHLRPLLNSADTGGMRDSTVTMNVVLGRPNICRRDGKVALYLEGLQTSESEFKPGLFMSRLEDSPAILVRRGDELTWGWLLDDQCEPVVEQRYSEREHRWDIRLLRGGRTAQTVSGVAPIDVPGLLGLSYDASSLVVSIRNDDGIVWRHLSRADGSWSPAIEEGMDHAAPLHERGKDRIIGVAALGDHTDYRFFDATLQSDWDWVSRVFEPDRIELVSMSDDHSRFLLRAFGPRHGYSYHLADAREHLTIDVGKVYENVNRIAEVRPIRYQAGDGLWIPAYLTLPPDREAKALPLVVLPHGGPESSDSLEFDWWAQAYAAQGYAVLQPNFRGSSLGPKWVEAGYGEWGRKMQSDLSDGVRYLVSQGISSAQRVCIVGASYGGYAALAGVTLESGVYRCAVAVAPVTDVQSFVDWVRSKEGHGVGIGLRYWERFLNIQNATDKTLAGISPTQQVDRISVPVLVIHGKDDITVPYSQSTDFIKAAGRAGKKVEMVTLQKEDHYLSSSVTRLQMLRTSVEFLRRNNPPD